MDKALQTMKEIYNKFVSSYDPSPTLSLEQNLSVWFEQNSNLYLYNYPENIKDDWKALIEECKEYIRKDGLNPD